MAFKRTTHWATCELHQFFLDTRDQPFKWGVHDCCLFPADAILAFTGIDLAADFRHRYTTEAEAFQLVSAITGGSSVADAAAWCAAKHGLVEYQHPLMAKRGDLVVVSEESAGAAPIAGIVHLTGRHVAVVGHDGLKRLSVRRITRAWAV